MELLDFAAGPPGPIDYRGSGADGQASSAAGESSCPEVRRSATGSGGRGRMTALHLIAAVLFVLPALVLGLIFHDGFLA
ncbi:hypothetical protein L3Q67_38870 [Saccharothrix sp. AJ9571]|nr:hypothetical protein L3Q67_38870 [Saccharothrix sp. AJ9571]